MEFLFSWGLNGNQSEQTMRKDKGRPAQYAFRQMPIGSRCTELNSTNVAKSVASSEPLMWQYCTALNAQLTKFPCESQTTNERLEGTLSQTPTVLACCISKTKSNFTRNRNENTKLEHAKLPTMWRTSLQNIVLHSQDLRVCWKYCIWGNPRPSPSFV